MIECEDEISRLKTTHSSEIASVNQKFKEEIDNMKYELEVMKKEWEKKEDEYKCEINHLHSDKIELLNKSVRSTDVDCDVDVKQEDVVKPKKISNGRRGRKRTSKEVIDDEDDDETAESNTNKKRRSLRNSENNEEINEYKKKLRSRK